MLIIFSWISVNLNAQYQSAAFSLNRRGITRLPVNEQIEKSGRVRPFYQTGPISGLSVNADIALYSDSSHIRIILVDSGHREYLVYETYPVLADSAKFALYNTGEETIFLNNIIPYELRFELADASLLLKEILISKLHPATAAVAASQARSRQAEKIQSINRHIQQRGGKWVAGETAISKLSYEEKKQLFGGRVPDLQGFEFYTGGIFVLPPPSMEPVAGSVSAPAKYALFCADFSWRDRHGQDWVTPVKYQGGCGSCWAFSACATSELLINLYYNRLLNYDLSEQELISCKNAGNCSGGSTGVALNRIQNGIVTENCFPYQAEQTTCDSICDAPSERISIGSFFYTEANIDDSLKKSIIKGPVSLIIHAWNHAVSLVGFRTIGAGDWCNMKTGTEDKWITVPEGDTLVGKTAWQIKNSWGTDWGDGGYAYVITDNNGNEAFEVTGPVKSMLYCDADILCIDRDGDGFYTWGIGPKPAHCPVCPDQPDGDDSNPCEGPMDAYGKLQYVTSPPVADDVRVKPGDPVPDLRATGNNIRWYDNEGLTHLTDTGNTFTTGLSDPGYYYFYVTQTLNGCESQPLPVALTIFMDVKPPVVDDVSACTGVPVQIEAAGENIKWHTRFGSVVDVRDGQSYDFLQIGSQLWLTENLNYRTSSGSSYYDHDSLRYANTYGRLYSRKAARKMNACPAGWRLSTISDWDQLTDYCKKYFSGYIGCRLKETGTEHWKSPNTMGTDDFGFCARPGGYGTDKDGYYRLGEEAGFWIDYDDFYSPRAALYYDTTYVRFFYYYDDHFLQSVRCVADTDGYSSAGNQFTKTFSTPGTYKVFVTQTVRGFESPPDTLTITVVTDTIPPPPAGYDAQAVYGQPIPDLTAGGHNIKWYLNPELTVMTGTGNSFQTGHTQPGRYSYYATQTIGCESNPVTVTLTIYPAKPHPENRTVCGGEVVPALTASGSNIKWYSDSLLTNLVFTGDTFSTGETRPGEYTYYVTQTVSDCESQGTGVQLVIYRMPELFLGSDTAISLDEHLILAADKGFKAYQWFDGTALPSIELRGVELGLGDHGVWLIVTDSNHCQTSDTLILTVVGGTGIKALERFGYIQVMPNPVSGMLHITFLRCPVNNLQVYILTEDGKVVISRKWRHITENGTVSLNLLSLQAGLYMVRISDDELSFFTRIIKIDR